MTLQPRISLFRLEARVRRVAAALMVAVVAAIRVSAGTADDAEWQQASTTTDGVTLRSRHVPGTALPEIQASCAVDATPVQVFEVAMRRDSYDNATKHVKEYRVVARESGRAWYTYERLSFPPIADRDYTLRYETTEDATNRRYAIAWTAANDRGPAPIRGVVRVTRTYGTLEMRPDETGTKTLLVCTLFADAGGWIPDWLIDYVNRRTVPDLLRRLRAKAKTALNVRRRPARTCRRRGGAG